MYQDALAIEFTLRNVPFDKEFYFTAEYKGQPIDHKHFLDFRVRLPWGPQRKPNAMFAMGRASTSEDLLPERGFGTCLEDSSAIGQGRTVLFVSHNMAQPLRKAA